MWFKQFALILFVGICAPFLVAQNVPKDAKEVAPGEYRVVSKDGKTETWRKTPFGFQKLSAPAAAAPASGDAAAPASGAVRPVSPFGDNTKSSTAPQTTLKEDGDSIRFERPTPFGVQRWTRKKTELTPEETKLWQAQSRQDQSQPNAQ